MDPKDWRARLPGSPELLPFAIDPRTDRVELLALQPVDYEKASFLDARLTAPVAAVVPFAELQAAAAALPVAADFIFHIGHAGSTLLSRLLGQHAAVFSLREPMALRAFATGDGWDAAALDARLTTFLALYSRTWRPGQRALIKATSSVGEIAGRLLTLAPGARAVMMTLRPEPYLATILGGPNSRVELEGAAASRIARLRRRFPDAGFRLDGLSIGELTAMSWVCEMAGLVAGAAGRAERVLWLDFDTFLADPAAALAAALGLIHGDAAEAPRLAQSPYLQRYSKAPEYAYGPEVRAQTLAAARRDDAAEIARGLAWLDDAARDPRLAPVLAAADSAIPGR